MLKKAISLIVAIVVGIFSGLTGTIKSSTIYEKKSIGKTVNAVVEALENKDGDKILSLMSDYGKKDIADCRKGINYILGLYKGKTKNIEEKGTRVGDSYNHTKSAKYYSSNFIVTTNNAKYKLHIDAYIFNNEDKTREGVERIILEEIDENDKYKRWWTLPTVGIYNPTWDDIAKQTAEYKIVKALDFKLVSKKDGEYIYSAKSKNISNKYYLEFSIQLVLINKKGEEILMPTEIDNWAIGEEAEFKFNIDEEITDVKYDYYFCDEKK